MLYLIQQKETWRQKKEEFIKARADVLEKLHKVLTQVHEETGILLIKPKDLIPRLEDIREDVKEIKEDDISAAANIPKLRAKLRKAELQAQVAAEKEPPLSDVEGTCATRERGQEASWKVMSSLAPAMVTTPRILDMDINRSRDVAKEILTNVSEASTTSKSVSIPPMRFFPMLYGYYKQPHTGIRRTRSEPAQSRKKSVKSFQSRETFLPPIATLYPENDQTQDS
ncbi:uncharacterized protein LOC113677357 [Pocillopora damicornis]|uniref:uncharacterized protein LOC113677357 n=1 Tax=Pocillopora damicornis TaxID=46731 RepID=UPI000F5577A0|nr:uncharacterized protein LOC113677357 [Pocillopora damicornis]